MYRSRSSFSNSNRNFRSGNQRRFSGFSRGTRGRMGSFDPSMLVKKAAVESTQSAYIPSNQFDSFALHPQLMHNVLDRGYQTLTPVQDRVIPLILSGKDVVGIASTGTGKTAAFLIPLIHNLSNQQTGRVLIMAPTRELAVQIDSEFRLFARGMELYSSLCIGGASMTKQINSLRRGADFIIGTPGRLVDLEKRHFIDFNTFSVIVLDEVDQMLDMGFIPVMKYVIAKLPQKRHSLFFSATLPSKLDDVINSFLTDPIQVKVAAKESSAHVNQDIVKLNGQSKIEALHDLLVKEGFDKVLVFGRTKFGLDKLARALFEKGFKVAAIHGNKSQSQRQRALRQFKDNYVQVLLATDIASRGLDIDSVTHVINYDLPQTYEDYIHRIGRTGRANKVGTALSFVD